MTEGLRLVQLRLVDGDRAVAAMQGGDSWILEGATTTLDVVNTAISSGRTLASVVAAMPEAGPVDLRQALHDGRVLPPIDHPDPAHLVVSGTGLTHLGSAEGRDKMHQTLAQAAQVTDSMRMFHLGLEGGRPQPGRIGAQPEWFYKGNGSIIAAPGAALTTPWFGLDGGEEPEIAGLYVIAPDGTPCRIGYTLGNEFSDHVTERQNYLYLAHSKLRCCALGPELLLGALPREIAGVSRIRRGADVVWEKPFLSGEANMCHTLGNLEHHHFKYDLFRRPGDVHVHFFGTSTLSFSDGIQAQAEDVFEVEASPFGLPLRNPLKVDSRSSTGPCVVKAL